MTVPTHIIQPLVADLHRYTGYEMSSSRNTFNIRRLLALPQFGYDPNDPESVSEAYDHLGPIDDYLFDGIKSDLPSYCRIDTHSSLATVLQRVFDTNLLGVARRLHGVLSDKYDSTGIWFTADPVLFEFQILEDITGMDTGQLEALR